MLIKKNNRIPIMIIITLVIVIILLLQCDGQRDKGKVDYTYITDTIYVNKPYEIIKTITKKTPPKTIKIYETVYIPADTVYKWKDKIIIITKKDSFSYNENFLTRYILSPKLLNIDLAFDTMNITILDTAGITSSQIYPLDFSRYKYQWYDGQLHHKKLLFKNFNKDWNFTGLYANVGFDFFKLSPLIGIDYSINWRFIRIRSNFNLYINQNPSLSLDLGVGFKLIKDGRRK